MSTIRKRLSEVEDRRAFKEFKAGRRQFRGRTKEELEFLAIHGYFPEAAGVELPKTRDFTAGGIRTIVTTEWMDKDDKPNANKSQTAAIRKIETTDSN